MSMRTSNCINGVVQSRGMGYEKCSEKESECLRSLVGVSRMDRVRNEEVRGRAGIESELASRAYYCYYY